MKQRIVLLGPPASGKGTQAAKIHAHTGIPATSTGSILRQERKAGTELGRIADGYTRDGGLVPDDLILGVVRSWLDENNGRFIMDGFPRTVAQGRQFDELLASRGTPLDAVIYFDTRMEVIRDRVHNRVTCQNCGTAFNLGRHVQSLEEPCPQCGGKLERRTDDTLAALEKRMAQYHELTEPLIPYYREQGLLTQIDANRDSEAVFADVADFLKVPLHA